MQEGTVFAVIQKVTEINREQTFRKVYPPTSCSVFVSEGRLIKKAFLFLPFPLLLLIISTSIIIIIIISIIIIVIIILDWVFIFIYLRSIRLHVEDSVMSIN